jgi:hypothetical protein
MSNPSLTARAIKLGTCLLVFLVLGAGVLNRPDWKLRDFDQVFYVTIAYDLDRWGVFSDGTFDPADSSVEPAQPGMFFGPVFPTIILGVMQLDHRFAEAVRCSVDSNRGHRDEWTCEAYETPIRLLNTVLLAIGVIAIGFAAELIFQPARWIFAVAALCATAALASETDIFSFVMTESTQFGLYSIFAWFLISALVLPTPTRFAVVGLILGILCLTKPSFIVLAPITIAIILFFGLKLAKSPGRPALVHTGFFAVAFACAIAPWITRNYVSLGKFGLSKEYASAALVERFAYDDMTAQEFLMAFPYCTPGVGDLLFDKIHGADSMHRFMYHKPGSFFHIGRAHRESLLAKHGELDPVIGTLVRDELSANWSRYLLVNIPLAWCGMWPGGVMTLLLLPLFIVSVVQALRAREPLILLYAAPAILMLGLHAAVGNHYTRYNFILIGPYSAGAAWVICSALPHAPWRARALASKS